MSAQVSEEIVVSATAEQTFEAVADVRRMARWSPECFAVWVWRRKNGRPNRFIGWNRQGPFIWFTTCQVRIAVPAQEFAFDVTTFGLPVARWGYRFTPVSEGTRVTEYWVDRRGRAANLLGRIFTGRVATRRPQVNRDGMRQTLERLKQECDGDLAATT